MQIQVDDEGNLWDVSSGTPVFAGKAGQQQMKPVTLGSPNTTKVAGDKLDNTIKSINIQKGIQELKEGKRPSPGEGLMWNTDGSAVVPIPGGIKDPNSPYYVAPTDAKSKDPIDPQKLANLRALEQQIADVRRLYSENLKGGNALTSLGEYLPTQSNRAFDSAGKALAETGFGAFRTPGVGAQSDAEGQRFVDAYAPSASDFDSSIEQKLNNLESRLLSTYQAMGIEPEVLGKTKKREIAPNVEGNDTPQSIAMRGGVPLGSGGTGSDIDIRWGGGSNGEFDRAGWLEKNLGWNETHATTYIELLNANKGKKLSADQLTTLARQHGIPVNDRVAERMARDASKLGNGRGWDPIYSQEQADWDKRVEELKSQRKDDIVNPVLRGAADTGLMGLSDNIFALTDTLAGGTYQDNLNERYATNAADMAVNPILRATGQVAGGIAPTLGLYKGVTAAGSRLAARGGKAGSLANSLAGNSKRAGTTANVLYGTGYGAASDDNALRGATIGAVSSLAGDKLGGLIGRKAAQSTLATNLRNKVSGLRGGRQLPLLQTSQTDNMILNADNNGEAIQKLSNARDLQVPMTLADTTPEFRALAGATARRSPTARGMAEEVFGPRSRGQYDRLIGAIDRDLGPTANIPQYSEDLIKQAQATARPLYDEAFSAPGASSVDISGIAKTPMGQKGISNAYNSVRNTLGPDGQPIDPTGLGFDIVEGTNEVALNRVPSFETLDYFKKGLDDIIDSGFDPMTKQYTADARAAIQLKQNLVRQMDNVNPAYQQARQAYAGPAGEREALRLGQTSGNMTPDQLQYTIKDFSPEKLKQFSLGDRSRMAEQASKVRYSGNPWESVYGTPQAQQRLAITHPNASPRFGQQYGLERDIAISNNAILGNSMTAERQLADQAFGGNMLGDLAFDAATTGAPIKTGATFLGRFAKDELGRMGAKKRAELLAPILFNPDAAAAANELVKITGKAKAVKRAKGIFGNKASRNASRIVGSVAAPLAIPFFQE